MLSPLTRVRQSLGNVSPRGCGITILPNSVRDPFCRGAAALASLVSSVPRLPPERDTELGLGLVVTLLL